VAGEEGAGVAVGSGFESEGKDESAPNSRDKSQ